MKSTIELDFVKKMTIMLDKCPIRYAKLIEIEPMQWCKAFFFTIAYCDIVDNHLCKAFNGRIFVAICKSIILMLEDIRLMIIIRFHVNKDAMDKWHRNLGLRIRKKLCENKIKN